MGCFKLREELACSAVVGDCRISAKHCSRNMPCLSLQAALCWKQVGQPPWLEGRADLLLSWHCVLQLLCWCFASSFMRPFNQWCCAQLQELYTREHSGSSARVERPLRSASLKAGSMSKRQDSHWRLSLAPAVVLLPITTVYVHTESSPCYLPCKLTRTRNRQILESAGP